MKLLRLTSVLSVVLGMSACGFIGDGAWERRIDAFDQDGDGFVAHEHGGDDCDDLNLAVAPGSDEHCDGIDNDCNGVIDDGTGDVRYVDADGDGFGDPGSTEVVCPDIEGFVSNSGDCDDTDAEVRPGAVELCNSVDDDCDGEIDDTTGLWYPDQDGDGFGSAEAAGVEGCSPSGTWVADQTDCDDGDADVLPGGVELCNGADDDCDGFTDDHDDDVTGTSSWYVDHDGDGSGPTGGEALQACDEPDGYAATDEDCDDLDAAIGLGADERCNGLDDDCDGDVDEAAIDPIQVYADVDGDGYGDVASSRESCAPELDEVLVADDCDDSSADVHPAALEICNEIDDDCDGSTDDADDDVRDRPTWYADADGDGYGGPSDSVRVCEPPSGYVDNPLDCDDSRTTINPDTAWYADSDGDGFGDPNDSEASCLEVEGRLLDGADCDDSDPVVHPGATEVRCDLVDTDCDGEMEEVRVPDDHATI